MVVFLIVVGDFVIQCIGGIGCIQLSDKALFLRLGAGSIGLLFEIAGVIKIYGVKNK